MLINTNFLLQLNLMPPFWAIKQLTEFTFHDVRSIMAGFKRWKWFIMNSLLTLISIAVLSSNLTSNPIGFATSSNDINTKLSHLSTKAPELKRQVLKLALEAYNNAKRKGIAKKAVLTVIDYSLPSSQQRMWVFDLNREKLLFNTYVAHGQNSGMTVPHHFSNQNSSKQTSLGTFVTRGTYIGSKGYSLNIEGLEKGFNNNAYSRRVVIHGAWYVEPDFIKRSGRAGRSWGCPAIAKTIAKPVINTIKNGSVIFAYYPDKNYLTHSSFLA